MKRERKETIKRVWSLTQVVFWVFLIGSIFIAVCHVDQAAIQRRKVLLSTSPFTTEGCRIIEEKGLGGVSFLKLDINRPAGEGDNPKIIMNVIHRFEVTRGAKVTRWSVVERINKGDPEGILGIWVYWVYTE
jgi:hypothetical protein